MTIQLDSPRVQVELRYDRLQVLRFSLRQSTTPPHAITVRASVIPYAVDPDDPAGRLYDPKVPVEGERIDIEDIEAFIGELDTTDPASAQALATTMATFQQGVAIMSSLKLNRSATAIP